MPKWGWAMVSAAAAGLGAMLLDAGSAAWSALVSVGVLAASPCSDTVSGVTEAASPMCVRPVSVVVTVGVTVAVAALLAGFVAYRAADR